jgi:hypothetical protein
MKHEFKVYRIEACFTKDKRCTSLWLQHPNGGRSSYVFQDNYDIHHNNRWIQIKPEDW